MGDEISGIGGSMNRGDHHIYELGEGHVHQTNAKGGWDRTRDELRSVLEDDNHDDGRGGEQLCQKHLRAGQQPQGHLATEDNDQNVGHGGEQLQRHRAEEDNGQDDGRGGEQLRRKHLRAAQ